MRVVRRPGVGAELVVRRAQRGARLARERRESRDPDDHRRKRLPRDRASVRAVSDVPRLRQAQSHQGRLRRDPDDGICGIAAALYVRPRWDELWPGRSGGRAQSIRDRHPQCRIESRPESLPWRCAGEPAACRGARIAELGPHDQGQQGSRRVLPGHLCGGRSLPVDAGGRQFRSAIDRRSRIAVADLRREYADADRQFVARADGAGDHRGLPRALRTAGGRLRSRRHLHRCELQLSTRIPVRGHRSGASPRHRS